MKAIVQDRYVSADGAVRIEDVRAPDVGDDEALVRVRAASAQVYRWDLPAPMRSIGRLVAGAREPKAHIAGLDFAGEVEVVGENVTRFQPGDAVFGWSTGALAQYVAVGEDALAPKPAKVSFAEAATIAIAGFAALQALRKGRVTDGHDVLIVGASGGVGSYAVQLAKAKGANVTGVCSTDNVELVRSLGADQTIDYTRADFVEGGARFDVIVDMAGNRSLSELRGALRPGGTLVMVGQSAIPASQQSWSKALGRWLRATVWSLFIDQRLVALIPSRGHEDLLALEAGVEAGDLTPTVTAISPLSDAPQAIAGLVEGHGRGRAVIEFPDRSG